MVAWDSSQWALAVIGEDENEFDDFEEDEELDEDEYGDDEDDDEFDEYDDQFYDNPRRPGKTREDEWR